MLVVSKSVSSQRSSTASANDAAVAPAAAAAVPSARLGADGEPLLISSVHGSSTLRKDGMRREWNFSLRYVHKGAQLSLHASPYWEYGFVDPESHSSEQLARLDRDVRHSPLLPILTYVDSAAVVRGSVVGAMVGVAGDEGSHRSSLVQEEAHPAVRGVDDMNTGNAYWVEKMKRVEVFYCPVVAEETLADLCKHSVKHMLQDHRITSVDGSSRLSRLRLGDKLRCPHLLGGQHRSFHFQCTWRDRSELQEEHIYAIGTVVGQRGYLFLVRCTDLDELQGYLQRTFLPLYTDAARVQFGVGVTYHAMAPGMAMLAAQQAAAGELQYLDRDAAVSLVIPAYPMRVIPDFSPAQTVGVGSITCLTLAIKVHERLLDDVATADMTGMPRYKVSDVILCLDVEEVSRMDYPTIMSAEQYSTLKVSRIVEKFPDAKVLGLPSSLMIGGRAGRSQTVSFTYEPLRCVVRMMCASTLVGGYGVTVLYMTGLSGGFFDAHLYLFQQLLNGLSYIPQLARDPTSRVSRLHAPNIRLTEDDVRRAYVNKVNEGSDAEQRRRSHRDDLDDHVTSLQQHLNLFQLSNGGRVDGGMEVAVPAELGGLQRRSDLPHPQVPQRASRPVSGQAEGEGLIASRASSVFSARPSALYGSLGDLLLQGESAEDNEEIEAEGSDSVGHRKLSTDTDMDEEMGSLHSASFISVSHIPRLAAEELSVSSDGGLLADEEGTDADTDAGDQSKSSVFMQQEGATGGGRPSSSTQQPRRLSGSVASVSRSGVGSDGAGTPLSFAGRLRGSRRGSASAASIAGDDKEKSANMSGLPLPLPTGGSILSRPGTAAPSARADASVSNPAPSSITVTRTQEQQEKDELYHRLLNLSDAVTAVMEEGEEASATGAVYGASLRDLYLRSCAAHQCKPNSYVMKKLPMQPELTYSVEEMELSSNYVGHSGFAALMQLVEHMPRLYALFLNSMSLDNTDAEILCRALARNTTVKQVFVKHNPGITLPATRFFSTLLRVNTTIEVLGLEGTRLGESVITRLTAEAKRVRGE